MSGEKEEIVVVEMGGRLLPSSGGRMLYVREHREYYVTPPSKEEPWTHRVETALGFPRPEAAAFELGSPRSILAVSGLFAGEDDQLQRAVQEDLQVLAHLIAQKPTNGNGNGRGHLRTPALLLRDVGSPPDPVKLDQVLREAAEMARVHQLDRLGREGLKSGLMIGLEERGGKNVPKLVQAAFAFDEEQPEELPAGETEAQKKARIEALREKAMDILTDEDPLNLVELAIERLGYGGHLRYPLIVYLSATTRLLAMRPGTMPAHLLLLGGPSSGKSYPLSLVKRLLPPEAVYTIDAGSGRVLIYDDVDLRHRMVAFSELESMPTDPENPATSALRNLLQDHSLNYKVTEKDPKGGFHVKDIQKDGPTVAVTSGVRRPEAQLDSRFFTLEVPDNQEQIQAALAVQGRLDVTIPVEPDPGLLAFQGYLQALAPWDVIVPFAPELAGELGKTATAPRVLRDFHRLLSLVKAVAVLRHIHRRTEGGRLVATLEDYARVRDLVGDMYAATAGISAATRQAVDAVMALRAGGEPQVTVRMVADRLAISSASATRRLRTAMKGRWLLNEENRKNQPWKLVIGDSMPADTCLPAPEDLECPPENGDSLTRGTES